MPNETKPSEALLLDVIVPGDKKNDGGLEKESIEILLAGDNLESECIKTPVVYTICRSIPYFMIVISLLEVS